MHVFHEIEANYLAPIQHGLVWHKATRVQEILGLELYFAIIYLEILQFS